MGYILTWTSFFICFFAKVVTFYVKRRNCCHDNCTFRMRMGQMTCVFLERDKMHMDMSKVIYLVFFFSKGRFVVLS